MFVAECHDRQSRGGIIKFGRIGMGAPTVNAGSTYSLYVEAVREAERHKWIESQKHGHDLGDNAIRDWYRQHWPGYCRCKRIEHVLGRRCWQEFEEDAFGNLYTLIIKGDLLLDRVLDRVDYGDENLDIILWAIEWGLAVRRVVELLELININRARLDPESD